MTNTTTRTTIVERNGSHLRNGIINDQRARTTMTSAIRSTATTRHQRLARLLFVAAAASALAATAGGCGPDFDPPSLIEKARVLGARVEVNGAPERATPMPGETATVTWLVTAPATTPPLGWAFALCKPAVVGELDCADQPLSVYEGTDSPPRIAVTVPAASALGGARTLTLYGRICASSMPVFNPQTGYPGCTDGGDGTTAAVTILLQNGGEANHNPTAERPIQLDGEAWAAPVAGGNPCVTGPRIVAGPADHLIDIATVGTDRETFTALLGDPPVPTPARENLQLSHFTTLGKMKSPYSFVEAVDSSATTTVQAKWKTPAADKVAAETAVTFTFVVRDGRGGTDWTTRSACVVP